MMQLHRLEVEHHHGALGDPTLRPYGNGALFWFEADDFDAAVARAATGRGGRAPAAPQPARGEEGGPEPPRDLAARSQRLRRGAGQPRRRIAAARRLIVPPGGHEPPTTATGRDRKLQDAALRVVTATSR